MRPVPSVESMSVGMMMVQDNPIIDFKTVMVEFELVCLEYPIHGGFHFHLTKPKQPILLGVEHIAYQLVQNSEHSGTKVQLISVSYLISVCYQ